MKRPSTSLFVAAFTAILAATVAQAASVPTLATGDSRKVTTPVYPAVCTTLTAQFSTSQRSSPPSSDDTSRLQSALNTCKNTGKSVVLAVNGSSNAFFSSTITVTGEALVLNSGVTLYGSKSYSSELVSVTGTNAAIMGPGTIDGRGDLISGTPRLVNAKSITNFIVYNVILQHAAKMHLYVEGGNGFTAWGITIATPANTKNTDGIDIDSLTNATVFGSFIEDGDDGVAIKTNSAATSNVTISGCTFHGTHGMSIGSQTMFGVTNVLWENNTVNGSDQFGNVSTNNNGINIKSDIDCGGTVKQVTYNPSWRETPADLQFELRQLQRHDRHTVLYRHRGERRHLDQFAIGGVLGVQRIQYQRHFRTDAGEREARCDDSAGRPVR